MAKDDMWKGFMNPPPECFYSGPVTDDRDDDTNPNEAYHTFPPSEHGKEEDGQFDYALWGAFDGRRYHGKGLKG